MTYVIVYFVIGILVAIGIGFNPRKEFHGFLLTAISWPIILAIMAVWIFEYLMACLRRENNESN